MRTSVFALLLLGAAACGTRAPLSTTDAAPDGATAAAPVVRLPDTAAEALARQCGRTGYADVMGYAPTDADLATLAADLRVLADAPAAPDGFSPAASVRQVVGLTFPDGRRRLYLNGFPASTPGCTDRLDQPCVVCTPGDAYWGALYDPQTRSFDDVTFNGAP